MKHKAAKKFMRSNEFATLLVLFAIIILFTWLNPSFLSTRNIFDTLRSMVVTTIFACGLLVTIVHGGIDLSFMAFSISSAYVTIRIAVAIGYDGPFIPLLLVSGLFGLLLGFCNAFLINTFRMPVFIITLAMQNVVRGLVLAFVGNEYVTNIDMPRSTIEFSKLYWFNGVDATGATYGLHFSVFIAIGFLLLTFLLLKFTVIGRGVFAVGGDVTSASRIGYNVKKMRYCIFGYSGLLSGFAGIIYCSLTRMADPVMLQGQELSVISAVVLGGASLAGGKGTIFGTIVGVMLTRIINNNLMLVGIPSYWQMLTFGVIVVVAVVFQTLRERRRKSKELR